MRMNISGAKTCGITNGVSDLRIDQVAYAPRTVPLAAPYTHLQIPIEVRTTIKAKPPFGAEMYRSNLFVAICRRLAGGQIARCGLQIFSSYGLLKSYSP